MGWWSNVYNGFKNVLGKAVGAGKWVQNVRDKALGLIEKAKKLPVIGSALDAGINAVMSTPIGSGLRMANNVLNAGVDAGDLALKAMEAKEKDGAPPPVEQLKEIGRAALDKVKGSLTAPAEPTKQEQRLDAVKKT